MSSRIWWAYDEGLDERDDLDEVLEEDAVEVGVGGGGLSQLGRVGFPFRVAEMGRVVLQIQEMLHRLVELGIRENLEEKRRE